MNEKKTYDKGDEILIEKEGAFYLMSFSGRWAQDKDGKCLPIFEGNYWTDWGGSFDNFKEVK
jgi:hypothetical protein